MVSLSGAQGVPLTVRKGIGMYHVVRVNFGICDGSGAFHQTHYFSSHHKIERARKAQEKASRSFNCVIVVDDSGNRVGD